MEDIVMNRNGISKHGNVCRRKLLTFRTWCILWVNEIINIIKSRWLQWTGHMAVKRGVCRILVDGLEETQDEDVNLTLNRSCRKWFGKVKLGG